ncbi:MAG: AEC family transporter [Peptococcaceae bacterium]|nr:AEC family transporter [Peptococcaceae bacterium]
MENLVLAFTVVFPLLVYLCLGYLLRRLCLWNETTVKQMNGICFQLFLPMLLFENVRNINLSEGVDFPLIGFAAAAVIATFFLAWLLVPLLEKEKPKQGVMVQCLFRSNFVLFGIPVALSLWGREQLGDTAAVVAVIVPLFNFLAVLSLELFREGKIDYSRIGRKILTNPLIVGALAGLLLLVLELPLPGPLASATSAISKVATPLGLMVLGGSFSFSDTKGFLRQLVICVTGRLIVVPALWLSVAALLGFRDLAIITLLPLFASPVATSSFAMAQQMDGDSDLAGQLVVYTSIFSIFTMFFWIVILKNLALF